MGNKPGATATMISVPLSRMTAPATGVLAPDEELRLEKYTCAPRRSIAASRYSQELKESWAQMNWSPISDNENHSFLHESK